jgi:hypothetical protein
MKLRGVAMYSRSDIPGSIDLEIALLSILKVHSFGLHAKEMEIAVIDFLQINPEILTLVRSDNRRELGYQLAWIRTKAKAKGYIERVDHGVWRLTLHGRAVAESLSKQ